MPCALQGLREILEELQFRLDLSAHSNAISVLFRVLIELLVDNYINSTSLKTSQEDDRLAQSVAKVAEDMASKGKIDKIPWADQ